MWGMSSLADHQISTSVRLRCTKLVGLHRSERALSVAKATQWEESNWETDETRKTYIFLSFVRTLFMIYTCVSMSIAADPCPSTPSSCFLFYTNFPYNSSSKAFEPLEPLKTWPAHDIFCLTTLSVKCSSIIIWFYIVICYFSVDFQQSCITPLFKCVYSFTQYFAEGPAFVCVFQHCQHWLPVRQRTAACLSGEWCAE